MVDHIGLGVEEFLNSFVTISFNDVFPKFFGQAVSRYFKGFAVLVGIGVATYLRVFHQLSFSLTTNALFIISFIDYHALNLPEKLAFESFVSMLN